MDETRIKTRIAAREHAEVLLVKSADAACILEIPLLEWPDGYGADYAEAFLERLRELLPQRKKPPKPEKPKPRPLSQLKNTLVPFGEFNGCRLCYVPDSRVDWYIRKMEENVKLFREYLHHPEKSPDGTLEMED